MLIKEDILKCTNILTNADLEIETTYLVILPGEDSYPELVQLFFPFLFPYTYSNSAITLLLIAINRFLPFHLPFNNNRRHLQ